MECYAEEKNNDTISWERIENVMLIILLYMIIVKKVLHLLKLDQITLY